MSVASKSKSNGLSKATPIDDKNWPFHDEDHNTFFRKIQNADSFPERIFLKKTNTNRSMGCQDDCREDHNARFEISIEIEFVWNSRDKFQLFLQNLKRSEGNKSDETGSTEIWTRIAGFKVQSANRYTIEPTALVMPFQIYLNLLLYRPYKKTRF